MLLSFNNNYNKIYFPQEKNINIFLYLFIFLFMHFFLLHFLKTMTFYEYSQTNRLKLIKIIENPSFSCWKIFTPIRKNNTKKHRFNFKMAIAGGFIKILFDIFLSVYFLGSSFGKSHLLWRTTTTRTTQSWYRCASSLRRSLGFFSERTNNARVPRSTVLHVRTWRHSLGVTAVK